ncbi:hypothetical protein D9M68_872230 [compost metagenome]
MKPSGYAVIRLRQPNLKATLRRPRGLRRSLPATPGAVFLDPAAGRLAPPTMKNKIKISRKHFLNNQSLSRAKRQNQLSRFLARC